MSEDNQPQQPRDLMTAFGFVEQTLKQVHENAIKALLFPQSEANVSGDQQSLRELDRDLLDCDQDLDLPGEEECDCGACVNCLRQDFNQQALEAFETIMDLDLEPDLDEHELGGEG